MKDSLYVIDPTTRKAIRLSPTSFFELNLKERQDLQSWLISHPEVLGEPLLLISSEFDRFDKSDKRLDLLLLDQAGSLVVAELKLDASGTLADQQAIRYAAFCSTMTMEDVANEYSRTSGYSYEDAAKSIQDFLRTANLPELNGEPRIMLVAGSFQDQELTSTVIWLRKFGVDISCIELTPYKYPGDEQNVLLVPKMIIPLTEAKEHQVRVERKERSEIVKRSQNEFSEFFRMVLAEYDALNPLIKGPVNPASQDYMQLTIGHGEMHYEWLVRRRAKHVNVAFHFESSNPDLNERRLEIFQHLLPDLSDSFPYQTTTGQWGKRWSQFCIHIPFTGQFPDAEIARRAALLMNDFVVKTLDAVKQIQ